MGDGEGGIENGEWENLSGRRNERGEGVRES